MESKKFVSDIIDINVLKPGDYVFINTQTGTGKTTFIVNVLFEYARTRGKKVLYLSNRCALSMQLRSELFAGSDIPMALSSKSS